MFVTGPDVIKTVTHEDVTKEELGGAMTHNATSGVAHFAADDDRECLRARSASCCRSCRRTTSTIRRGRPTADSPDREDAALDALVPASPNQPYDMLDLIHAIADDGDFLEVHQHYAKNIIVGFARLDGRPVGIVANQPAVLAGTLDIDASVKGARFVRFCDAFNIPLVTFEDVPGLSAGDRAGVRRHHPAWREAAVRVRGSDGAEGDGHHAQGLRRRVLRDVEQAHPDRFQLRLADRRARRDGAGRRGQHPLQARDRRGRPIRRGARARRSPSSGRSSPILTSPPRAASSTRSSARARRGGS